MINKNILELRYPEIRKISEKVSEIKNGIDLTIGLPDFNTPQLIKEAGIKAIINNNTRYTENKGLSDFRAVISKYISSRYGLSYSKEEITITNGASQAIDLVFRTILNTDDEVIVPSPTYLGYRPIINMANGKVVELSTLHSNFKLEIQDLKKAINKKTKALLLVNPSNPTGVVYTKEELERIITYCSNRNIYIVVDEIYANFVYDNVCFFSCGKLKSEKLIIINGLSKSHSMTGWRIGFILSSKYLSDKFTILNAYSASCACSISQNAALVIGNEDMMSVENDMKQIFNERMSLMYEGLLDLGFEFEIKPKGSFYLFPNIKRFSKDSIDFSSKLLEATGVAVVPGDAFSTYKTNHIRISVSLDSLVLTEALSRMKSFLDSI